MSNGLMSVEEGLERALEPIRPVGSERVDLLSALGRIIAEDIYAPADVPAYANSAMDGYAVRAADTVAASKGSPAVLTVIEDLPAGYVAKSIVGPGQAIRIMTGAPIPEGADSVVMVEVTEKTGDGRARIFEVAKTGQHVRPRGEDVRAGDLLIRKGTELGPAEVGVLASSQRPFARVARRPVVAIVSTGDELVEVDEPLAPGKVVNANSYSLAALVRASGAVPIVQSIARDSEQEITDAIESALAADFIVSSGGVSVGDYDYVKKVLADLGAEIKFWRVSMKPGKPIAFGTLHEKPYFGLPGNTVSSMLSFLLFVRPALRKAMGCPPPFTPPIIEVVLTSDARSKGDRRTYLRATLDYREGKFYARLMPRQGSGVLSSMLGATALVILDEGVTEIKQSAIARALLIGDPFKPK
jgi:molybdopterin molybdotransferase